MIKAADAIKNFSEEMQKEYDDAEATIDAAIRRMRGDVVSVDLSRVSPCQRVLMKLQRGLRGRRVVGHYVEWRPA